MGGVGDTVGAPSDGPLLVEFVGLPGSGKSTIARELGAQLRAAGTPVEDPGSIATRGSFGRVATKSRFVLAALVREPVAAVRWEGVLRRTGPASWREHVRVTFNWFYLIGLIHRYRRHRGAVLLDQGLLQALWSAGYTSQIGIAATPELADALGRLWPARVAVVSVSASEASVRRRLASRIATQSRLEGHLRSSDGAAAYHSALTALGRIETLVTELQGRDRVIALTGAGEPEGEAGEVASRLMQRLTGLRTPSLA